MKDLTKVKCDVHGCQAPIHITRFDEKGEIDGYAYSRCVHHRIISGEKGKSPDKKIICSENNCELNAVVYTDKCEYHHQKATGMSIEESTVIPKGRSEILNKSIILMKEREQIRLGHINDPTLNNIKKEKDIEKLRLFVIESYLADTSYFKFIMRKAFKTSKRRSLELEIEKLKKQIEQKEREYNEVV